MSISEEHSYISNLIPENSGVIDIGCGRGELLKYLMNKKSCKIHGIEFAENKVADALANGLSVIQADADNVLSHYPDAIDGKGFDVAILCKSLQVFRNPKNVLDQSLRIAKKVIIITPNFGHIYNRLYLGLKGKMPVSKNLSYQWYETPNIHFSTVIDMLKLAEDLDAEIHQKQYFTNNGKVHNFSGYGSMTANLFARDAAFILSRSTGNAI